MSSTQVESRSIASLLNFADEKDIDGFLEGLRKYEAGEMTSDEFRLHRLARGTYGQRQADVNMIRVKFPMGAGNADQLDAMAEVCDTYSRGFCHVTTRQNFQIHFVKLSESAAIQRILARTGLTTKEACGNTVRNVTGCVHAGVSPDEPFDVTAYGHAVARHFLRRDGNQKLPRKFKIALSGCANDCAMGAINDVGLIAKIEGGVRGFKVKVAGGLSTTPEDAHLLYEFLPADELLGVLEAVVSVFDKHGNRQNKSRARLKYVVRKNGWDGFKKLFDEEYAAVNARGGRLQPIDASSNDELSRTPSLPIADGATASIEANPGYQAWFATNVSAQKQKGFSVATVRLRRGDITSAQLRGVAALARAFTDGQIRLTIDQNILIRFVSNSRLPLLWQGLVEIGLAEAGASTIADVTSCPGADSCNLAVTQSRELATLLSAKLESPGIYQDAVDAARKLDIKISGCPNSCGQHHIAAIGFHGGMRRVGKNVVPEYTLHLGGGIDGNGATFGRQGIVKLPARRCGDALLELLALYLRERSEGEQPLAYFRRVDPAVVKTALASYVKIDEATAVAEDFMDNGENFAFQVDTKEGECAV